MARMGYKKPFDYVCSINNRFYFLSPSVFVFSDKYVSGPINTPVLMSNFSKLKNDKFIYQFLIIKLVSFTFGILRYFYEKYYKNSDKIPFPIKAGYAYIESYDKVKNKKGWTIQSFSIVINDAIRVLSGIEDIKNSRKMKDKKRRIRNVLLNLSSIFKDKESKVLDYINSIERIYYDLEKDSLTIDITFITFYENQYGRETYFEILMEKLKNYYFFAKIPAREFFMTQNLEELCIVFGRHLSESHLNRFYKAISLFRRKSVFYSLKKKIETEREKIVRIDRKKVKTISKNVYAGGKV